MKAAERIAQELKDAGKTEDFDVLEKFLQSISGVKIEGHKTVSVDTDVRGYRGTASFCICGWTTSWSIRDGSAESDAARHMSRFKIQE